MKGQCNPEAATVLANRIRECKDKREALFGCCEVHRQAVRQRKWRRRPALIRNSASSGSRSTWQTQTNPKVRFEEEERFFFYEELKVLHFTAFRPRIFFRCWFFLQALREKPLKSTKLNVRNVKLPACVSTRFNQVPGPPFLSMQYSAMVRELGKFLLWCYTWSVPLPSINPLTTWLSGSRRASVRRVVVYFVEADQPNLAYMFNNIHWHWSEEFALQVILFPQIK